LVPTEKPSLNWPDVCAGLVLTDPILFRRHFFADNLSLPPSREQKLMWCDASDRVLYCTGRKIAKTIDLEATIIQHGILRDGEGIEECLCFTPSDVHMVPILDRVWERIERVGLFKLLVADQRRGENTILQWLSGVKWYFRIEGLSGTDRNVVGLRAAKVLGDELAFGQIKVYDSLLQTALPTAQFKLAGVPNGVRLSTLYQLDQTEKGKRFSRHKYSTFINPIYADPVKQAQLTEDYGGVATQGYVTQVLGQWGEEMVSSFPPGSFIADAPAFRVIKLSAVKPKDLDQLPLMLAAPSIRCARYAVGVDHGFSPDPSEIHIAVDRAGNDLWEAYLRVQLRRVDLDTQVEVIRYLMEHVAKGEFVGLGTDKLDLVHKLQDKDPARATRYFHSNPGASTEVDVDLIQHQVFSVYHSLSEAEKNKKRIKVPNKTFYHGLFKQWLLAYALPLDGRKLRLGRDGETEDELVATVERKTDRGHVQYFGPPDPNIRNGMLDHIRESWVYLCDAVQRGMVLDSEDDKEADLIAAMGWAGGDALEDEEITEWTPPWEDAEPAFD
jgi:hypothetical protein